MRQLHLLCYLLLLSAFQEICGQTFPDEYPDQDFTVYTKQQGLSHNTITGIVQDSVGYIWIATPSGLNRFDGSRFVQFHGVSEHGILPFESVSGLKWLDKKRLAAYGNGIHIIDTYTERTRNLLIPYADKQYQFKFNRIKAVTSNRAGDVFVLSNSGFYHFDKAYNLVYRYDYYPKEQVDTAYFAFGRKLLWLDDEHLAIVSIAGIYFYNTVTRKFKPMEAGDFPLLSGILDSHSKDFNFFQPRRDRLFIIDVAGGNLVYIDLARKTRWISPRLFASIKNEIDYRSELISVSDSLFYLTGNLSGYYVLGMDSASCRFRLFPQKQFPAYFCKQLMQDRDHNLWIATNKGLFRQNNFGSYIRQAVLPAAIQTAFPNMAIQDLYITRDKIYAATKGNAGLLIFDKAHLSFVKRVGLEKVFRQPPSIYSITPLSSHELWLAANGPLLTINTDNDRITEVPLEKFDRFNGWIADMYKDRTENIWIAAGNIYRYDFTNKKVSLLPPSGIDIQQIVWPNKIQQDADGNIWFAGHGLLRYNIWTRQYDRLVDSLPFLNLPDKQINCFLADGQDNLWINCNNNGLLCYDITDGTFRRFSTADGLPDNNIAAMIIVKNKLWLATFSGMASLDLRTFKITSFGKESGFPDESVSQGSKFSYDDKENRLYIGYSTSLVSFDPDVIFKKSPAPQLFIESIVTADQKKLNFPGPNFATTWRNHEITINIGSVNFSSPGTQRFAYRLDDDGNSPWQELGSQNTFSISNLSSGRHLVQVKLYSSSNQWPEQIREMTLLITPPFWQELWFRILFIAAIILAVFLVILWSASQIRKKEKAKTQLQKLIADEYKNQFELEQISNYFSSSLADKKNVEDVLWDISKNLIGRMNYVDCMIYLWNEDRTKMVQKASYGPKGDPKAISSKIFDVAPGQGIVGHVMQTREPLIVADTSKDPRYRVDDIRRLSEICVPIMHNGEMIGIIDSEHHQANHFQERDIKILTTIATLISNKIKQIESEQTIITKQQEIADINQRLAEAQLLALQTQMNPHFIFNSLNSIKRMILENEQQRASRYMSKFANMLRITLHQSKEVFTTLYENMEHLENYLSMEKLRFDDTFTFRITADDTIDKEDTLIPTMMIQPLAENAVWHGLMPKKGRKRLLIHFSKEQDTITCRIEDNGIGIRHAEQLKQLNRPLHRSVGISNLRNRIKILNEKYDSGCHLDIIDLNDTDKDKTGSCAILSFRIINKLTYESNFS